MRTPTPQTIPMMQTCQRPRWHGGLRQAGPIAVALVSIGLLAACSHGSSGPRVAGAGSSTSTAHSSGGAHASALAYAQCMRSHGLTDFPDPDSSGNIDLKSLHPVPGSDLYPDDPRFQAAASACQSLWPTVSASQQHQDAARALKWAQCMRAHGISNFPDPSSTGDIRVSGIHAAGVDLNSPQFKAVAKACQQYQPGEIRVPGGAGEP
ncbi:MAG TPA: hypothetical protein VNW94_27385 [Streptosporangiaceae bacterium]|nr:hypothetical protein [Streptosporangiaceae bacterium]